MQKEFTTKQIEKLNLLAGIISIVVPGAVLVLMTPDLLPKLQLPFNPLILPPIYATINALTAVVLLAALYFIKQKNVVMHSRMIYTAMVFSVLFLIGYILYHSSSDPTKYGDLDHDGLISDLEAAKIGIAKSIYYFFLISHILLSAIIVPFVLFTFVRGYTGQVEKHRKLAKWSFPMWLYVAVSGVICYLMLAPYYPI